MSQHKSPFFNAPFSTQLVLKLTSELRRGCRCICHLLEPLHDFVEPWISCARHEQRWELVGSEPLNGVVLALLWVQTRVWAAASCVCLPE